MLICQRGFRIMARERDTRNVWNGAIGGCKSTSSSYNINTGPENGNCRDLFEIWLPAGLSEVVRVQCYEKVVVSKCLYFIVPQKGADNTYTSNDPPVAQRRGVCATDEGMQ